MDSKTTLHVNEIEELLVGQRTLTSDDILVECHGIVLANVHWQQEII